MDEAVIAFLSLGSKYCPVDLDLDRKQKGDAIDAWIRRLRLKTNYQDEDDTRTEEEEGFYLRTGWFPEAGKYASLDMFIYLFRKKAEVWIPPGRIKDNMTAIERKGMEGFQSYL